MCESLISGHRVIAAGGRLADSVAIRALLARWLFPIGGCSMTHYVGLDVSQKLTAICISDDTRSQSVAWSVHVKP